MKIQAIFTPLIDSFASVVLALIIWYGGGQVLAGAASLGVVAAFIGYSRRFFQPIREIAEKVNMFQSAFASLERVRELMEVEEKISSPARPRPPKPGGGAVEFRGVSFGYGGAQAPPVLKDLSFKLEAGQSLALVGPSGCGKSSVINLMLRAYNPQAGSILFDGLDLRELDLRAHRARVALVAQDVYLYCGTVLDNLRLGRRLEEKTLKAACEAVGAEQFIRRLPRGYHEEVGPGGRRLSAGERQLLACARAFLGDPQLIILDEATATVDHESEAALEPALKGLLPWPSQALGAAPGGRGKSGAEVFHFLPPLIQIRRA